MIPLLTALAAVIVEPTNDCANAVNQADMNACTARSFKAADRALNAQWRVNVAAARELDKELDVNDKRPSHYSVLVESQRAWLRYRTAQCASEGYMARNGSLEPTLIHSCLEHLTRERIKELSDLAKGLEG